MALKDTYFNISEAAVYLGVTRQTLSRWITEGKIAAERVGNAILIDKNHIYDYENQRALGTISSAIIKLVANRIRQEFNLGKDVTLKFIDYKDAKFTFLITEADGTKQEAFAVGTVKLDRAQWRLQFDVGQLGLDDAKPNKNKKTIQ